MSNVSGFTGSTGAKFSAGLIASASGPREVFIELGDSKKKANVVRDKVVVPAVEVDFDRFDDFVLERPKVVNKVVSQSIPAGTVVSEGAAIDLILAPAKTVPGNIFTEGHLGLKDKLLADVFDDFIAENDDVKRLLAKRPDVADLTTEDVAFISAVAEEKGVTIESTPGNSPHDLFATWQIANTFAG
jgi:hypothetical protein